MGTALEPEALDPAQFGVPNSPWGQTQRYVRGKNGKPYRLQDHGNCVITANSITATHDPEKFPVPQARVGMLTFFPGKPNYNGSNVDGGVIYKASVRARHQRNGLATAMLTFARERYPDKDVRHSNALSDEGRAWAEATPTPNDLRRP